LQAVGTFLDAALARWAGLLEGEACPGLLSVFAITADFAAACTAAGIK